MPQVVICQLSCNPIVFFNGENEVTFHPVWMFLYGPGETFPVAKTGFGNLI